MHQLHRISERNLGGFLMPEPAITELLFTQFGVAGLLCLIFWWAHTQIMNAHNARIKDRDDVITLMMNTIKENTEAKHQMAEAINRQTDLIKSLKTDVLDIRRRA